jgi:predicted ABC-type ATPase
MGHEAAAIAATAREALIAARLDFCTETVFSHPSKVDLIDAAVAAGYDVILHVVMVPLHLSAARVQARVAAGGHDVPREKIVARYARIWPNVVASVPRCRRSVVYDNAMDAGPVEVGAFRFGLADYPPRWPAWTPEVLRAALS